MGKSPPTAPRARPWGSKSPLIKVHLPRGCFSSRAGVVPLASIQKAKHASAAAGLLQRLINAGDALDRGNSMIIAVRKRYEIASGELL